MFTDDDLYVGIVELFAEAQGRADMSAKASLYLSAQAAARSADSTARSQKFRTLNPERWGVIRREQSKRFRRRERARKLKAARQKRFRERHAAKLIEMSRNRWHQLGYAELRKERRRAKKRAA